MNESIQVDKDHYRFMDYTDIPRWISYYFQIKEALDSNCKSFLIAGKGDGIVPAIIYHLSESGGGIADNDFKVHTFDYDKHLSPTYTGDIRKIKKILGCRKYDCIIACQILEHIEWKYFSGILKQLSMVCNKKLILSLPMCKFSASVWMDFPKLHNRYLNIIIPRFWKNKLLFDGEHYWEAGIRRHTKKDILKVCCKYFIVEKNYHPPLNAYHWFIIMHVNKS